MFALSLNGVVSSVRYFATKKRDSDDWKVLTFLVPLGVLLQQLRSLILDRCGGVVAIHSLLK